MEITTSVQAVVAAAPAAPTKVIKEATISVGGSLYEVTQDVGKALAKATLYAVDSLKYTQNLNNENMKVSRTLRGQVDKEATVQKWTQIVSYVTIGLFVLMVPITAGASLAITSGAAALGGEGVAGEIATQVVTTTANAAGAGTSAAQGISQSATGYLQQKVTNSQETTNVVSKLSGDESKVIRAEFKSEEIPGQALNNAISSFAQITRHRA